MHKNNTESLVKELIKNICIDLNKKEKIDELTNKYLNIKNNLNNIKYNNNEEEKIKKPKTSYMFFLEDVRPKIVKKYPNDKLGDISKKLGKLWSNLKDKDKRKYIKKAEKDKIRYKNEKDNQKKSNIINNEQNNIIEKSHTLFKLDETNIENNIINESNNINDSESDSESNSESNFESDNKNNIINTNKEKDNKEKNNKETDSSIISFDSTNS